MELDGRRLSTTNTYLPVWVALSMLAHLLLASLSGGAPPPGSFSYPVPLVVNINHVDPKDRATAVTLNPELGMKEHPQKAEVQQPSPASLRPKEKMSPAAELELPVPFDSYFYEVDVPAQPTNDVLLRYPWIEFRQRLGGVVRIALLINDNGGLDNATVVSAAPPGHFEEAAMEAVKKLKFTPALKAGRHVKSRKTIEVVFDPSDQIN